MDLMHSDKTFVVTGTDSYSSNENTIFVKSVRDTFKNIDNNWKM